MEFVRLDSKMGCIPGELNRLIPGIRQEESMELVPERQQTEAWDVITARSNALAPLNLGFGLIYCKPRMPTTNGWGSLFTETITLLSAGLGKILKSTPVKGLIPSAPQSEQEL